METRGTNFESKKSRNSSDLEFTSRTEDLYFSSGSLAPSVTRDILMSAARRASYSDAVLQAKNKSLRSAISLRHKVATVAIPRKFGSSGGV